MDTLLSILIIILFFVAFGAVIGFIGMIPSIVSFLYDSCKEKIQEKNEKKKFTVNGHEWLNLG